MVIIKLRQIFIIFVFSLVVFLHFHSDRFRLVKSRKTLLFKVKWAWFCLRKRLALCICLLAPGMLEAGLRRHGCTSSLVSNCFSLLFPCSNTEIPRWQRKILWQLEKMTFSDHLKTLHDHFVCRFDFLLYNNTDGLDFYFWSLLQWVLSLGLCWRHSLGERLICRAGTAGFSDWHGSELVLQKARSQLYTLVCMLSLFVPFFLQLTVVTEVIICKQPTWNIVNLKADFGQIIELLVP